MRMLIRIHSLIATCLLLTGCMLTQKVSHMNTHENIYYHANTVYVINSKTFLVRHIASNDKWPSLYTLWKIGDTIHMTHGTINSVSYVVNPADPFTKSISDEYALSHYPYTYFPKCNININNRDFKGDIQVVRKDITDFGLTPDSLNNAKSSTLGDGINLCNGIDVIMTSNLKHLIEVYIIDDSIKDKLTYSMYEFSDINWNYTGEDQIHMEILKYTLTPFAFAADIVTSPIQLFFLPFAVGGPGR